MNSLQKQKALDKIAKEIQSCEICQKNSIGMAVPGEGDPDADLVFLGEAPGKQEAQTGKPFIGRAGKVLRTTLEEIGIKAEDVYITSPVKYLPKYVTPKLSDIEHGRIHLNKQLDVISPKIIVLMGKTACIAMLNESFRMTRVHGEVVKRDGREYFISLHPAAVLYANRLLKDFKADFKKLKRLINSKKG